MKTRKALIAGASGLVGGYCLRLLLESDIYEQVTAFVRREIPVSNPKLVQRVIDFNRIARLSTFPRVDDVFCSLGTTIKTAGSQDAFYKVDFTYVHELARLASLSRSRQFLLVSSQGANPKSGIFYTRVKGEIEEAVKKLAFEGLYIFRPSLLVGQRSESRPGEAAMNTLLSAVSFALVGPAARYRPIKAETVASAMVRVARQGYRGTHVFESDRIRELGEAAPLAGSAA